ncbi:MAG: GAF domain-containing protein [Victivallales bacterium]|nr:GAF domain-containing protein [Victivallales bacterium]MBT7162328.1 GAF domain-containing protein [Victivallales bacterium]MBT7304877.1 GAF domain-containing protein [Victivallales bacterium]
MTTPEFRTSLDVLRLLSDALTVPHTLDEGLAQITRMNCELMQSEQTTLLLRDEGRQELIVRTCLGVASDNLRVGHPIVVPARMKRILWRTRYTHQINWIEAGIEHIGFPILVTPISVRGTRVGLLITGKSRTDPQYDVIRQRMHGLIATFASLVIENAKIYDYLRQQFAQRSKDLIVENRRESNGTRDEAEQLMISSLTNPDKVVRLLAESFYKELSRAGFSAGNITMAAAHILECITREEPV